MFKCALNETIFTGDESTMLDGTAVLSDDILDSGEEPKAVRG